jgi:hypothetical protein
MRRGRPNLGLRTLFGRSSCEVVGSGADGRDGVVGGSWGNRYTCDERCDCRQLLDPSIGTVGRWQGEGCVDLGVGQRRLSTVLFIR